jgi:hypothetical protein
MLLGAQGGLVNLNQVTLPVKHMSEATAFYLKLGFTQIVDTPHYARFECADGNSTFSLTLETGSFVNGVVIYFEHEKLDQWDQSLKLLASNFIKSQQIKVTCGVKQYYTIHQVIKLNCIGLEKTG